MKGGMKYQLYTNASKNYYDPSWKLQLSEFVWTLCSSVWVVFNKFLFIDATNRSKNSSDQKRLFFAIRLYPLSFFASTPFNDSAFLEWHVLWTFVWSGTDISLFFLHKVECNKNKSRVYITSKSLLFMVR